MVWEEDARSSTLELKSQVGGKVALVAEMCGPELWSPSAWGWLGIQLWRGQPRLTREDAKRAALSWWRRTNPDK